MKVNGLAHRDIKLSNICCPVRTNSAIIPDGQDNGAPIPIQIKLADFGMAGFVEKGMLYNNWDESTPTSGKYEYL